MLDWLVMLVTFVALYIWLDKKPKNFPPGPPTLPIVGSLPFIQNVHFHYQLEKLREKYGQVIGLKFGTVNAVAVCGYEAVMEVFKRDDFAGRNNIIMPGRVCEGVMMANGEIWKNQRRFFLKHVKDFGFGKSTVSQMYLQEFQEFCAKRIDGKTHIAPSGLFNVSAINVLWAMIAGKRLDYEDEGLQTLMFHLDRFFREGHLNGGVINTVPGLRKFLSFFVTLKMDESDKHLRQFMKKHLNEHRATKTAETRDFFDVYIDELEKNNKHWSFHEDTLCEVLKDFFGAGTESAGNSVSYCILHLLRQPEWQEKVFEEIERVIGKRAPIYEDHYNMPITHAYITEVMRINTIAPFTVPHAAVRDTTLMGYFLPKDTFIHVSVWAVLQDKKHWGDPEVFRPERFLNEEGKFKRDPYFVPFGAGIRGCPGESLARNFIFLYFVFLVQKYKFSNPIGREPPATTCMPGFTTPPKDFIAAIEPRIWPEDSVKSANPQLIQSPITCN